MSTAAEAEVLETAGNCGAGQAWRAGRILVLSLAGDSEAIGRQHGTLARAASHAGAVPHLASAPRRLDGIATLPSIPRWLAIRYVDLLYWRIYRDLGAEYRAELAGIAAGSGLSPNSVFRASLLSETLQMLVGASASSKGAAAAHGGCTAAVMLDAHTGQGLIHGKNQDYDAAGHWDNSPALVITRLDGAHAYAKATSAGLLKGNLSLNSQGLSIGGHMLFSSRPGTRGATFTALENDIMRRASSLGEAIDILRRGPRLGCFAFVIGDGRADEAAVVECDGDAIGVRPAADARLGMANLFTASETLRARDLLALGHVDRNPRCRQSRIDALLSDGFAEADQQDPVAAILGMLADRVDPVAQAVRAIGPLLAGIMTVTSAATCNARLALWMSDAPAPTSAGRFIGFDLGPAFDGQMPGLIGTTQTVANDDPVVEAQRCFIAARRAFEEHNHVDRALKLLARGGRLAPDDPAFPRFMTRLLIRQLRLDSAQDSLAIAYRLAATPNELAEAALLQGHLLDLQGCRTPARAAYSSIRDLAVAVGKGLDAVAPALVKLAHQHEFRVFDVHAARELAPNFSLLSGLE